MNLPQIRLQSTQALIALNVKHANLTIQQPEADLRLEQPPAEMTIRRTPSKLTIDQTAAFEAVGIKSRARNMEEYAADGKKGAMDGIARRAREGNELMRIENGGNPIVTQAIQDSTRPEKQFNIGFIPPQFSVKLHYEPTKLDINWKINKVVNNTTTNKPILDYYPGNVDTSIRQKNTLEIDFVNVNYKA